MSLGETLQFITCHIFASPTVSGSSPFVASMPLSSSEKTQRKSDFPSLLALISEDLVGLPGDVSQTLFLEGTDPLLSLG